MLSGEEHQRPGQPTNPLWERKGNMPGKKARSVTRSGSRVPKRRRTGEGLSGATALIPGSGLTASGPAGPAPPREAKGEASRGRSGAERRQSILPPAAEGLGYAAVSALGELWQTMANAVAPAPPPTRGPPPKPQSPSARFRSPGRDLEPKMDPSLQRHALLVGMSTDVNFGLHQCKREVSAMEEVSL